MLINNQYRSIKSIGIMSNTSIIISHAKERLQKIAEQTTKLAVGLQSVAPSELPSTSANTTVQYLFEISDQLNAYAKECELLIKSEN